MSTIGTGTIGSGTIGSPVVLEPEVITTRGELRMFPLQIADIVYSMQNFLNSSYTEGVPSSANSIVRHLSIARLASCSELLYPSLGTHTVEISHHRVVGPGQSFKATSSEGGVFYGKVIHYNPYTGLFIFRVESISSFVPSSNWEFDFRTILDVPSSGGVNVLSNKLTGQISHDGVLTALELHNIKSPWVYFEDFFQPMFSLNEGLVESVTSGTVAVFSSNAENSIEVAAAKAYLYYSDKGFFTVSSVGRLLFEARVAHPSAVSDAVDSYKTFIGLKGEGSTEDAPFSLGGVGFYCTNGVNSGNWVCLASNGASLSTTNTSVTPVANTYALFKITVSGGELKFYINNTLVATTSTIPVADPDNLMRPLVGIQSHATDFTELRTLKTDYFYLEVFGD